MSRGLMITWDGNPSSAIPELIVEKVDRGMFGDVLDAEVQMPGREGAWVFSEVRGNRTIRAAARVVADDVDERRPAVSSVAAWLNVSGYANLLFSDQVDRYWRAFLRTTPDPDEWKSQGKFVLEWRAEPFAYSITTSSQCVTAVGSPDNDTFIINDDLPACPVIEITPLNGTITEYTLILNGYSLTVGGSISQGNTQTVSSCSYTITGGQNAEAELNGAYMANPHWTVDASGEFPLLVTGTNEWSFQWDGTATQVEICIYWRERMY